MNVERLAEMANDIGAFFVSAAEPEAAVAGIADHIGKFWTPRMREQLTEQLPQIGDGIDELPRAALLRLAVQTRSKAQPAVAA